MATDDNLVQMPSKQMSGEKSGILHLPWSSSPFFHPSPPQADIASNDSTGRELFFSARGPPCSS